MVSEARSVISERPEPELRFRLEPVERCPVCSGPGATRHAAAVDRLCHVPGRWEYQQCAADGNLWLGPRPIAEDLGLCYPGGYFTHSVRPFPEHSTKSRRDTAGKRLRSFIEYLRAFRTMPCTYNACFAGSMIAVPP